MSEKTQYTTLSRDQRAVAPQIGFILLFGIAVILLSIWQAQVVPAENAEVEFNHYEAVQTDLLELRSDYIDAAETGTTRSATVQLGTQYPTRVFFVNGPPPQGRLTSRTVSNGTITADGFDVARVCGLDGPVETRSLVLDTDYNELGESQTPPYRYENTVLYRQTTDGGVVFESNQSLVQGSTLNLYPLTSNTSESGIDAASVEFSGAETGEVAVDGPLSVTIPTALSAAQWDQLLAAEPNAKAQPAPGERVTIELADAAWTVRCAAVGAERTPAVTDPPDTAPPEDPDDEGGGGGVGSGSVSDYSDGSTSDTFTSANGRWTNITCTDQLVLSDAQPARFPDGDNLEGQAIRLNAFLNNSTGNRYSIDVRLARGNEGDWNTKTVTIYDGDDNDDSASLTTAAADQLYDGGAVDLLELVNYDDPSTGSDSFSGFVRQIRALEDGSPVDWQTTRVTGRVTVALECDSPSASGVSVDSGSTPGGSAPAIRFDMQVDQGTTKTITAFEITTPGNQNDDVGENTKLKRSGGGNRREVRLTVLNTGGVNQSGGLEKNNLRLDGTQYSLDRSGNKGSEATFSDGAVMSVDMGNITVEGEGATSWTYDLADSRRDADAVVTFYFEDGTRFQVYLRVTDIDN